MPVVELPENYVAFVLPDESASQKPPQHELEHLRIGTLDYVGKKLKTKFPSFQRLELEFLDSEFGTKKPYPKFHLYIRAKATAHFDSRVPPDTSDVFEIYVSSFNEDYLEKSIRKLKSAPSLVHAIEVRSRKIKTGTPSGAVTAPRFYMAFVRKQEPTSPPSKTEREALLKKCNAEFTRMLKEEFEDDFDKLTTLKIVKTEIGENAGKPDPKFNIYIEFEAVAAFHQNVPDHMDFFRAISNPPRTFVPSQVSPIGGIFQHLQQMAVRCVFVESPDLPEPPKDDEEDQDAAEPDEGEGEEKEQKEKERLQVHVELGFYVALVIPELASMPNEVQLYEFDQLMRSFFSDTLSQNFEDKFVKLTLEPSPRFQASIPLPRFNLLHQYDATIHFYHPPPDGDEVLRRILYCNLPDLYNKISQLPPPYNGMAEFTMGRALEKQITNEAYGGVYDDRAKRAAEEKARKEAEEKKRKEEEAQKAAEEKRRKEEAARRAAEEKKRKEEEARKAAEEKRRKEEEARKAAEEKRRKEEAARKAAEEKRRKEEEARKAAEEKRRKEEEARKAAEEKRRKEEEARKAAEEKRKKEEEARKALEEKKRKEEEARKAAEEKRKREEEARKAAEEKKRKEEEARKVAEEKRRKEEEARKAAEEKKRKEEEARKVAEEKRRREEEARKAAEEKKRKEDAARKAAADKAAAEEKRRKEEAARKAAEEKKRKEEAAKKATEEQKKKEETARRASARRASVKKDEGPTIAVGTADVFVAFTLPNIKAEPTKSEYEKLAATTKDFYTNHLKSNYSTCASVEVSVSNACYGQDRPNNRYQVYIEWNIKAKFLETGGHIPDRYELCTCLVNIDMMTYMLKHVQPLRDTPFSDLRGMFTEKRNK